MVDPNIWVRSISTHAPRVRRDGFVYRGRSRRYNFYSRASCEARLQLQDSVTDGAISTHAPRVRRDLRVREGDTHTGISTHAPRVRRDVLF